MKITLDSEVQQILEYLCPRSLRCRKCKHALVNPVRKGNAHYCRNCVKPPTRKADPTLFEFHCRWVYFTTNQHQDLTCGVCTRFLLEPVALNCCGNKLCSTCLKRVKRCPFCRHYISNAPVDRSLIELMKLFFDSNRYRKLVCLLEKENALAEQSKAKAQEYLDSNRLDQLIDALEEVCRDCLEWYLECTQVVQILGQKSGTEPCEAEFQLVLRQSPLIGKAWVKTGEILLRCRLSLPKFIQAHPEMRFEEMQSIWIASTVAHLLNRDVDLELAKLWLSNNYCTPWLMEQLNERIDWLDDDPLEGDELLRAVEQFQSLL